jgi:hypothetical protein
MTEILYELLTQVLGRTNEVQVKKKFMIYILDYP